MPNPVKKPTFAWTRLPKPKGKGPKLGKTIRHDIKHLFHELYEKSMLLREVDPSFKQEMTRLGFDKPFDLLSKAIEKEQRKGG